MNERGHNGRGIHDIGGLPGEPVDFEEHERAFWEKRVDALWVLCTGQNSGRPAVASVDELRRSIEALGIEQYDTMSYYERWISALTSVLLQRDVFTLDELGRKMAALSQRDA